MDTNEEEKIYEYFTNRPIGFMFYFTLSMIVSALGIFGNLMLIYTKLKRFYSLVGLEFFLVSLAVSMISLTLIFIILVTDEMFHEFSDDGFCNLIWFLQGFSKTSINFSIIAVIIAAKYFSKISRQNAAIVLAFVWVAALFDSYPYYTFVNYPVLMKNGKSRKICHISFDSTETIDTYYQHQITMAAIEIILPSIMLIATSCVAFLWKKPDASTNKTIFLYALTIGIYYMVFNSPLAINRITTMIKKGKMSLDLRHVFRFLLNVTAMANPIIYGYFDKFFMKEVLRIIRVQDADSVVYEHHDDKNIEDV